MSTENVQHTNVVPVMIALLRLQRHATSGGWVVELPNEGEENGTAFFQAVFADKAGGREHPETQIVMNNETISVVVEKGGEYVESIFEYHAPKKIITYVQESLRIVVETEDEDKTPTVATPVPVFAIAATVAKPKKASGGKSKIPKAAVAEVVAAAPKVKRPPSAYNLYIKDAIARIKATHADMKGTQLMQAAVLEWKAHKEGGATATATTAKELATEAEEEEEEA